MSRIVLCLIGALISLAGSGVAAEASPTVLQDFVFIMRDIPTTRQANKTLNIVIKYRYESTAGMKYADCVLGLVPGPCNVSTDTGYLDYNLLRKRVMEEYLEPTPLLPINIYWETVNLVMTRKFMSDYNITAISSMIQVRGEWDPIVEPGNHGSIVTIGDVPPLTYQMETFQNSTQIKTSSLY